MYEELNEMQRILSETHIFASALRRALEEYSDLEEYRDLLAVIEHRIEAAEEKISILQLRLELLEEKNEEKP